MAEAYIVDVDLDRVRQHLARIERQQLTESDVRRRLVERGFYPRTDGLYIAEEAVLRQLDPSEIIAARPVAGSP